jgi:hypothetical protein
MGQAMTSHKKLPDIELADFLGLNADEAAKILPNLTPEKRAAYEHMHDKYMQIMLWEEGVAPFPDGAIVDGPRQIRMGKP